MSTAQLCDWTLVLLMESQYNFHNENGFIVCEKLHTTAFLE